VRKSGQMGVPVIDINGHIVVGFDRNKIDRLLGLR
ncbi:MAG: NrdH-redoxin, partial [Dictyoglomus sp.]